MNEYADLTTIRNDEPTPTVCGAYFPATRLRCTLVEGHHGQHQAETRRTGVMHSWPHDWRSDDPLIEAREALSHVDDEAAHCVLSILVLVVDGLLRSRGEC